MDTKNWWESKTIWSGIVVALRGIYQVLQFALPLFTPIHLPPIPPIADSIAGMVLGGAVVHGRYTADTTLQ